MSKRSTREVIRLPFSRWFLLCLLGGVAFATGQVLSAQERVSNDGTPIDGVTLQKFFDANLPIEMETRHAPGAIAVIVKDGQIVFEKGYGISDLAKGTTVDPDKTLFHVASVSKIITTFAVLELVDQGKLDLHADINRYLKLFQIPSTFQKPVTLSNLLTHTGGFDERQIAFTARSRSEQVPLGTYLQRRMPPRVMPAGEIYNYSNHGFALAGYLVELVANEPFEKYVEDNVFQPLDMNSSSFDFRPSLFSYLAGDYSWKRGGYQRQALDFPNIVPAVSLTTTATDMGHFMEAILGKGSYRGRQILSAPMGSLMLERQFTHDPRIPGVTLGFYESLHGKQRVLIQNGEWFGAASLLVLIPERGTGFFMAVNSEEVGIPYALLEKFLKEFFPEPPLPVIGSVSDPTLLNVSQFAGNYVMDHYARNSIEKLAELVRPATVQATGRGTIHVQTPDNGGIDCVSTGPLLFRAKDSALQVAFRTGDGKTTYFFVDHQAYRRLRWYEYPRLHLAAFMGFALLFGLVGLGWPIYPFWFAAKQKKLVTSLLRRAQFWAGLAGWLNVIFLGGMAACFYFREQLGYYFQMPRVMIALLWLPLVTTAIAMLMVYLAYRIWKQEESGARIRLQYSVVAVAAALFVPFLAHWNLWGFRY